MEEVVWKEPESMTPEVLERICTNDILLRFIPRSMEHKPHNITAYGYAQVPASDFQKEKVVKGTLLMLNRKKRVSITAMKCVWERFTLYITRATDEHVFTLWPDTKPNHFRLRGGLYPVNYTNIAN